MDVPWLGDGGEFIAIGAGGDGSDGDEQGIRQPPGHVAVIPARIRYAPVTAAPVLPSLSLLFWATDGWAQVPPGDRARFLSHCRDGGASLSG